MRRRPAAGVVENGAFPPVVASSRRVTTLDHPSEAHRMRSPSLAALVALVVAAAALGAAEGHPTVLTKGANIRFGPDTNAPAAGTLPAGTPIEVLEQAKAGWMMIRFPRGCTAWMHEKVLDKQADGKFKVMEDKARVRADATLGSAIVAEMALGDVVEATGKQNGQWYSVYPANAVAYVSEKLVDRAKLPAPFNGKAVGAVDPTDPTDPASEPTIVDDYLARLWTRTQDTYEEYKAIANSDNTRALGLDWPGLSDQLGQVVAKHQSRVIQLQAERLKNGVDRVVDAQRRSGNHPTVTVPEPAAAPIRVGVRPKPPETAKPKPDAPVVAKPVAPKTDEPAKTDPPAKPDAPAKPDQPITTTDRPVVDAPKPDAPAKAGVNDLLTATGGFTVEGWLEARDVPEVGAAHVIIDANSNVVAYLKPKPGVNVQFSEYFWRLVTVTGTKTGDHDGAAVMVIESVSMPGR
jgi:SH3-like domain-containing protein